MLIKLLGGRADPIHFTGSVGASGWRAFPICSSSFDLWERNDEINVRVRCRCNIDKRRWDHRAELSGSEGRRWGEVLEAAASGLADYSAAPKELIRFRVYIRTEAEERPEMFERMKMNHSTHSHLNPISRRTMLASAAAM